MYHLIASELAKYICTTSHPLSSPLVHNSLFIIIPNVSVKLKTHRALVNIIFTSLCSSLEAANIYYMDGSVDPYTSTAAVAFIHDNDISHIYLPNSSSMMQTELLAILKAFQHAEFHQKSIVIHIDSLGAIQTLKGRQLKDNVKLITTILCMAQAIHESGRRTYINWITSHVGIMGNEEADYTARNTLLLAQVTPPIPFSISGIKSTLKTTSCKVAKNQLHH